MVRAELELKPALNVVDFVSTEPDFEARRACARSWPTPRNGRAASPRRSPCSASGSAATWAVPSDIARGGALSPLLDQLEQRAAELEADNHRQRRRISQLEVEVRELTETLDAARAMNRS